MKSLLLVLSLVFSVGAGAGESEVFRLYPQEFATPSPGCDIYQRLELIPSGKGYQAVLIASLGEKSLCMVMLDPTPRVYELEYAYTDRQGIQVYKNRTNGAVMRDYRKRGTRDLRASIQFDEPTDSEVKVLFSIEQ